MSATRKFLTILLVAALIFGPSPLLPAVLAENRVEVASLSILDPTGSAPRFATSSPSLSGNKLVPVTLAWNDIPTPTTYELLVQIQNGYAGSATVNSGLTFPNGSIVVNVPVNSGIPEGTYDIYAKLTYGSEFKEAWSNGSVIIDNTPPQLSSISLTPNIQSGYWFTQLTGTITASFSWSEQYPNSVSIDVYKGSNFYGHVGVSQPDLPGTTGTLTKALTFTVPQDGTYDYQILMYDRAGNKSTDLNGNLILPDSVRVDSTPPEVSISWPTSGSWLNGTVEIKGTSSNGLSGVQKVEISTDNTTWVTATGTANWTYSLNTSSLSLSDGSTFTVYARATDNAGLSTATSLTYNYDSSPPTITLDSPPSDPTYWRGPIQTLSATNVSDPHSGVQCVVFSVTASGYTWTATDANGTDGWSVEWSIPQSVDPPQEMAYVVQARAYNNSFSGSEGNISYLYTDSASRTVYHAPGFSFDPPTSGYVVRDGTADWFYFTVTLTNPTNGRDFNTGHLVRVKFVVHTMTTTDISDIEYYETYNNLGWTDLPVYNDGSGNVYGWFGPSTGFPVPPGYNATSNFRVKLTNTASIGSHDVDFELWDMGTDTIPDTIVVSDSWAINVTGGPSLTLEPNLYLVQNYPRQFWVNAQNPSDGHDYTNALFRYRIQNITTDKITLFQYWDGSTWQNMPMTQDGSDVIGYFGPSSGFPMPPSYSATTNFRIQITQTGTYPVILQLWDLSTTPTEYKVAELTSTVTVYSGPSLQVSLPYLVDSADPRTFTVTCNNPAEGQSYSHALFRYRIQNITTDKITLFQYWDGSTWQNMPMTQDGSDVIGYFGPSSGFPMPPSYSATTNFRIQISGTGRATYPVDFMIYDLDPDPDYLVFSTSQNAEVYAAPSFEIPAVSLWDGPTFGLSQTFTITTNNPAEGQSYSHALFRYRIANISVSEITEFKYYDTGTNTWYDMPKTQDGSDVIGYFGPSSGFPMPAPYQAATLFKITIHDASTSDHSYNFTLTLEDIDADYIVKTVTGSFTVKEDHQAPTVNIISPNGGEYFSGGTTTTITWTAVDSGVDTVKVDLSYSTDNGSTWNIIASDLDNTGSYTWLIPIVDSTNCLVKVTARDLLNNETSVQSANTFTIDSTDPVISNLTATPSADISSTRPTTITALASEPCTWTVIVHRGGTPTSPIVATLTQGLSTSLNLVWTPSPSESDGTHLIEVQAVDQVSRSTTSSLTVEVYNHSIKITGLRILDWTGTPTDTFHPGGYYAVEITVKNLESSSLNALVVIRSKDPTNTLLHLGAFNVSLNAGEERCLGAVGFVLPPDALTGNWTVESFVWNHWVSQPGWASLSSTVRAYFQVVP